MVESFTLVSFLLTAFTTVLAVIAMPIFTIPENDETVARNLAEAEYLLQDNNTKYAEKLWALNQIGRYDEVIKDVNNHTDGKNFQAEMYQTISHYNKDEAFDTTQLKKSFEKFESDVNLENLEELKKDLGALRNSTKNLIGALNSTSITECDSFLKPLNLDACSVLKKDLKDLEETLERYNEYLDSGNHKLKKDVKESLEKFESDVNLENLEELKKDSDLKPLIEKFESDLNLENLEELKKDLGALRNSTKNLIGALENHEECNNILKSPNLVCSVLKKDLKDLEEILERYNEYLDSGNHKLKKDVKESLEKFKSDVNFKETHKKLKKNSDLKPLIEKFESDVNLENLEELKKDLESLERYNEYFYLIRISHLNSSVQLTELEQCTDNAIKRAKFYNLCTLDELKENSNNIQQLTKSGFLYNFHDEESSVGTIQKSLKLFLRDFNYFVIAASFLVGPLILIILDHRWVKKGSRGDTIE